MNPEFLEEGERSVEKGDGSGGGFIREELGESEAAVAVDGQVRIFQTSASDVIALAVAGYAMADALDAGELLDIEVEEFAWVCAFVALDRWRLGELREALSIAAQEAGDTSLGEFSRGSDPGARLRPRRGSAPAT